MSHSVDLKPSELERYDRQMMIKDWGVEDPDIRSPDGKNDPSEKKGDPHRDHDDCQYRLSNHLPQKEVLC